MILPQVETLPPAQKSLPPLTCHRCGAIDQPRITPGKGPHASAAQCGHCGHFIQWLSRYTPADRQARHQQALKKAMEQRPPSQLQLAYLQALGDDGPVPGSMLEASDRIDTLVRGEVA